MNEEHVHGAIKAHKRGTAVIFTCECKARRLHYHVHGTDFMGPWFKPTRIKWILVDSTNLRAISYDRRKQVLHVRFHNNNTVYRYEKFPSVTWRKFMNHNDFGETLGEFFQRHIAPFVPSIRIQ